MDKKDRLVIAKKAKKLRREEGMTWKEISERFGKTPATLRNYRKELNEQMKKYKNLEKAQEEHTQNILQEAIQQTENIDAETKKTTKKETEKTTKKTKMPQESKKTKSKDDKINNISSKIMIGGVGILSVSLVVYLVAKIRSKKVKNETTTKETTVTDQKAQVDTGAPVRY